MTVAVRALPNSSNRLPIQRTTGILAAKPSVGTLLIALAVMISGLAIVYMTDLNRRLFIELQAAQATENQLHMEWGKLLLEQSTWATQARVQSMAQQRLGMEVPESNKIVILKIAGKATLPVDIPSASSPI